MQRFTALAGLVFAAAISMGSAQAPKAPGATDPAPDFELKDSKGNAYRLSELRGKNVILEFIRSGSWSSQCKKQLGELQEALPALERQNTVLLVISKYDAAETASWLAENKWTMPVLVDGRSVMERYGILNAQALDDPDRAGIPHPTTLILNPFGLIQWKQTSEDDRERTSREAIFALLAEIID